MSQRELIDSNLYRDTIVSFDQSSKFRSDQKSSLISRSGPDKRSSHEFDSEFKRKAKLNLKDKEVHIVPGAANLNKFYLNEEAMSYFNYL